MNTEKPTPMAMQARFVRCGDRIDGHEVIDTQRYLTSFVGDTIEFRFADRPPMVKKLDSFVMVVPVKVEE